VVLDEPNASLDYLGERVLFEAIERMKAANTTVIIITHRVGNPRRNQQDRHHAGRCGQRIR